MIRAGHSEDARCPKNRRAGCLLCKPQKANGADRRTVQEQRADEAWNREMVEISERMLPLFREAIDLMERAGHSEDTP